MALAAIDFDLILVLIDLIPVLIDLILVLIDFILVLIDFILFSSGEVTNEIFLVDNGPFPARSHDGWTHGEGGHGCRRHRRCPKFVHRGM
jgi:hypothetical protein